MGKPGVYFNCDTFNDDAISASNDHAMPTIRHIQIKSSEFYRVRGNVETIRPMVEAVFDEIINALIVSLTDEEANPPQQMRDEDGPPVINFTADSYSLALEQFNQDFLDNRWGDGLPLIPPTSERVRWMLSGTSRSPEEVLARYNLN